MECMIRKSVMPSNYFHIFWQWNDNFNQVKISQIERAVNGKRTRVVGRVLRKSVCVRLCVILFDNLYLHHLTSYSSFICYQKRRSSKNNWAPFSYWLAGVKTNFVYNR